MKNTLTKSTSCKTSKKQPRDHRPLTITIEGELAAAIRDHARAIGFLPSTTAKQFLQWGSLCVSGSNDARKFRLEMGQNELEAQGREQMEGSSTFQLPDGFAITMPTKYADFLEEFCDAARVNPEDYLHLDSECIQNCIAETLEGGERGFPGLFDPLSASWELDPDDFTRMRAVARKWAGKLPLPDTAENEA